MSASNFDKAKLTVVADMPNGERFTLPVPEGTQTVDSLRALLEAARRNEAPAGWVLTQEEQ